MEACQADSRTRGLDSVTDQSAVEITMMAQDRKQKTTYHLEMTNPADLRPASQSDIEIDFRRVEIACPEFNWFLHEAVGAEFRWGGREDWEHDEWTAYVDRPELETWVAYVMGTPAGYCELEAQDDGSVRIECFGLLKRFFGNGIGGTMLTAAVDRCWALGANRVWLTTCSHDHAHALRNYMARGFALVAETTGPPNPQRDSALFAKCSSSHMEAADGDSQGRA